MAVKAATSATINAPRMTRSRRCVSIALPVPRLARASRTTRVAADGFGSASGASVVRTDSVLPDTGGI
jgi:hypothetical protein